MRLISRIWKDITHGRNIEIYILVPIAIYLACTNYFLPVEDNIRFTLIFSALGILAWSALNTKHRFEDISQILAQTKNLFSKEFPESIEKDIKKSEEILLIGVSLTRTIRTYYSDFEIKLRQGHRIRVLLVEPNNYGVEMAVSRHYGRTDINRTNEEIDEVIKDLFELRNIDQRNMEIRTINNPLSHGLVYAKDQEGKGVLYIENYPYKTRGGSIPKFVLRENEDEWYSFYKEEAEILWKNGQNR